MQTSCQTLDINKQKKGLARPLQLSFTVCLYANTYLTSKQINLPKKNKGQQKLYEVNVRAIYGCRQAGRHYTLMKKRKVLLNICNSVALIVYIATYFPP